MTVQVRVATVADLAAIGSLLVAAGLAPAGGARLVLAGHLLVAEDLYDGILGCIGIEPIGHQALLRSLAVRPSRLHVLCGASGTLYASASVAIFFIWLIPPVCAQSGCRMSMQRSCKYGIIPQIVRSRSPVARGMRMASLSRLNTSMFTHE